jgi:hypothetical protein
MNLDNSVVIHPKPSHNMFPMDGALVGVSHISLLEHSSDLIRPCSVTQWVFCFAKSSHLSTT